MLAIAAGALPLLVVLAAPVQAAGLSITTPYPAVQADPGGTVRFPLTVTSTTPERVDLTVTQVQQGFEATFRGGGSTVDSVYTNGSLSSPSPTDLQLQVTVPDGAAPGDYPITIRGVSGTETVDLPLALKIKDTSGGEVTLTTDFPSQRGPNTGSFTFPLTLKNDTSQEVTFGVQATGPPDWTIDAKFSGEAQAATAVVAAGDTITVNVTADPSTDAAAGAYEIDVLASGGTYSAQTPLSVELTGTYSLSMAATDGRLNTTVTSGSSANFSITLENTGSAALAGITMTSTPPTGWKVTYTPATVDALDPGATATVTAAIAPADNALAGDYVVTMRASSTADGGTGAASDSIDVRTTVETSSLWGFVGLALIALVVIGLVLVFWRYGRR